MDYARMKPTIASVLFPLYITSPQRNLLADPPMP